jgi:hypothetical protein
VFLVVGAAQPRQHQDDNKRRRADVEDPEDNVVQRRAEKASVAVPAHKHNEIEKIRLQRDPAARAALKHSPQKKNNRKNVRQISDVTEDVPVLAKNGNHPQPVCDWPGATIGTGSGNISSDMDFIIGYIDFMQLVRLSISGSVSK